MGKHKEKLWYKNHCEFCGAYISHNKGTESDVFCVTCEKKFAQDKDDLDLWGMLRGDNV